MKPIIGITPDYTYETKKFMLSQYYIESVQKAGGYPVMLFPDSVFPDFIDGLLLTGGGDIDPIFFEEEPIVENGEICPLRDVFEWSLCKEALKRKLPVFGICRGMQLLALLEGGSIYQDIYKQTNTFLKHIQKAPRFYGTHTIDIAKESMLEKILGKQHCIVNTFHHQSVKDAGKNFKISAKSRDNLIEAIEHRHMPFVMGVQWHPEAMTKDTIQLKLFEAFVKAAKER